ncbi:MAG TPA: restriction endonuclease subunit S [Chitinophagaceae bacterium]|nr:restriction endonuclease subunit S [Chitinophagaceae bacterium]
MAKSENTKPFHKTEIPSDWEVTELGKIFDFKNGINAGKESYGKGVKFINVMEVIYSDYITSEMIPGSVQISDDQKELYQVKHGDVLFNRTSETIDEIGLTAVYYGNDDVVFGGFVIRGRPVDSSIDDKFKRYCFRSKMVRDQIIKSGQGAVRTNIGQGDLEKVEVPLPKLPEQKAIAHILSLMDTAINKNNLMIAKKELQKKWLIQNLLTGKKRVKGYAGEWKEIHIRDIAKEVSIKNKADKQLTVLSCTKYDGLVPSLEYFGRKIFADDVSTYKVVPKNHFAYATNHIEEGSIGYQEILDEALISPMYTVFKTDSTVNDSFLYKLLKSHNLVFQYNARMEGSIDRRGGLRWDAFSIIKIHIPSIEEQTAIAQVLQAADKEIQLLKMKTEKLREKKKGLMQQLLTGKKRLKIEHNGK